MKPTEMTNGQITEALSLLLNEARKRASGPLGNADERFRLCATTERNSAGEETIDIYATFLLNGSWQSSIGLRNTSLDGCIATIQGLATQSATQLMQEDQDEVANLKQEVKRIRLGLNPLYDDPHP